MTELMVNVDGRVVALAECGWFHRKPCGCIVSAIVAVVDDRVLATAEQAHKHMFPDRRSRERHDRDGHTWELMTMTHYREHIGARWECAEHAKGGA